MALDFEALRKKLMETQRMQENNNNNSDIKWFNPKDGLNIIRILPGKHGGNSFYAEAKVHWIKVNGKNRKIVCRETAGHDDCPICKISRKLYEEGERDKAREYRASTRYYFNVIDRNKPDEGPMVYNCGVTVFNQVLSIILDPDYGDITDPEKGFDLKLTKTRKGGMNVDYNLNARREPSPIGVDGWKENMVDLQIFTKVKSVQEILDILKGKPQEIEETNDDDDDQDDVISAVKQQLEKDTKDDDVPWTDDDEVETEEEDDDEGLMEAIRAAMNKK